MKEEGDDMKQETISRIGWIVFLLGCLVVFCENLEAQEYTPIEYDITYDNDGSLLYLLTEDNFRALLLAEADMAAEADYWKALYETALVSIEDTNVIVDTQSDALAKATAQRDTFQRLSIGLGASTILLIALLGFSL
jgi:hypothetical protein